MLCLLAGDFIPAELDEAIRLSLIGTIEEDKDLQRVLEMSKEQAEKEKMLREKNLAITTPHFNDTTAAIHYFRDKVAELNPKMGTPHYLPPLSDAEFLGGLSEQMFGRSSIGYREWGEKNFARLHSEGDISPVSFLKDCFSTTILNFWKHSIIGIEPESVMALDRLVKYQNESQAMTKSYLHRILNYDRVRYKVGLRSDTYKNITGSDAPEGSFFKKIHEKLEQDQIESFIKEINEILFLAQEKIKALPPFEGNDSFMRLGTAYIRNKIRIEKLRKSIFSDEKTPEEKEFIIKDLYTLDTINSLQAKIILNWMKKILNAEIHPDDKYPDFFVSHPYYNFIFQYALKDEANYPG